MLGLAHRRNPSPVSPPICRGEVLRFRAYSDTGDEPIFLPGQRLVVAAVNEARRWCDGGLQCFPIDRYGSIGMAGDTLFVDEIFRAFPVVVISLPLPWASMEPRRLGSTR